MRSEYQHLSNPIFHLALSRSPCITATGWIVVLRVEMWATHRVAAGCGWVMAEGEEFSGQHYYEQAREYVKAAGCVAKPLDLGSNSDTVVTRSPQAGWNCEVERVSDEKCEWPESY